MKHKLTALLLSLVLCVSLCGTAFAADATASPDAKGKRVFIRDSNGVTVTDIVVPADGKVDWDSISAYSKDGKKVEGYILSGGAQVPVEIAKDSGGSVDIDPPKPDEDKPLGGGSTSGGGSSGGGGGGGSHGGNANGPGGGLSVSIGSANHGSVTFTPQNPAKGTLVTLKVRPNAGYTLDSLSVTDSKGAQVDLTKISETKYTFIMPNTRVIVNAKFSGGSGEEAPSLPASGFYDVPDGYWAANEIAWASANGVMNGVGGSMFSPGTQVNRQQTWMVLGRLAGAAPASMAAAREWAMSNGVSDGTKPTNPLSRQQLVALLYRYAQLKGIAVEGAADLGVYPDQGSVAEYAKEAMAWAVGNGIVAGTSDGRLNPEGTATRAQFAVIMYRFSQKTAG